MRIHPALVSILAGAAFAAVGAPGARAQSGGAYDLGWNSLAGGGQTFAAGGAYTLGSTAGNTSAGALAGGAYTLAGGFWSASPLPTTGVGPAPDAIPRVFAARLAGANPSHGPATIQFDLPAARPVSVSLYGVDGRLVRRLVDGPRGAGRHTAYWDGTDGGGRRVGPGMYFARVLAGESRATLRIVRIR